MNITVTHSNRYYYLKDHLGNIRVTVNEFGQVEAYNDYYPFGLQMPGRGVNNAMTVKRNLHFPKKRNHFL